MTTHGICRLARSSSSSSVNIRTHSSQSKTVEKAGLRVHWEENAEEAVSFAFVVHFSPRQMKKACAVPRQPGDPHVQAAMAEKLTSIRCRRGVEGGW